MTLSVIGRGRKKTREITPLSIILCPSAERRLDIDRKVAFSTPKYLRTLSQKDTTVPVQSLSAVTSAHFSTPKLLFFLRDAVPKMKCITLCRNCYPVVRGLLRTLIGLGKLNLAFTPSWSTLPCCNDTWHHCYAVLGSLGAICLQAVTEQQLL